MITQEMEEFAAEAIVAVGAASLTWDDAQKYAEAVIKVVYPLILGQAAEVCMKIANNHLRSEDFEEDMVAAGAKECWESIRNLKDKTDE